MCLYRWNFYVKQITNNFMNTRGHLKTNHLERIKYGFNINSGKISREHEQGDLKFIMISLILMYILSKSSWNIYSKVITRIRYRKSTPLKQLTCEVYNFICLTYKKIMHSSILYTLFRNNNYIYKGEKGKSGFHKRQNFFRLETLKNTNKISLN